MLDFFKIARESEPWQSGCEFYLKDPQASGEMAFSIQVCGMYGRDDVNAIVRHSGEDVLFVPIDFNPAYVAETPKDLPRCDGMLYSRSRKTIAFVELKNRNLKTFSVLKWTTKGVEQLASVIRQFKRCNPTEDGLEGAVHVAYVCNQQSPYVAEYASTKDKMAFLLDPDTFGFQLFIKKEVDLGVVA